VQGVFVQLDMIVFQIQGKHAVYQVSLSIGVEWSGNVTAAGSTIIGGMVYIGWAVGVLRRRAYYDLKVL